MKIWCIPLWFSSISSDDASQQTRHSRNCGLLFQMVLTNSFSTLSHNVVLCTCSYGNGFCKKAVATSTSWVPVLVNNRILPMFDTSQLCDSCAHEREYLPKNAQFRRTWIGIVTTSPQIILMDILVTDAVSTTRTDTAYHWISVISLPTNYSVNNERFASLVPLPAFSSNHFVLNFRFNLFYKKIIDKVHTK